MKKMLSMVAAAVVALGCASAMAETKELYPSHKLDMETYGTYDSVVHAEFDPANIVEEYNLLCYDVYDNDVYAKADIEALQPGDKLFANDETYTVEKVEATDEGYDINGGYITEDSEGDGVTLVWANGGQDELWSMLTDDYINDTMIGQAGFAFADEVTLTIFQWDENYDFSGDYEVVTLPAAEVKAYLMKLAYPENPNNDPDVYAYHFTHDCTTVTLKDGVVTEIRVDWNPAA